MNTDMVQLQVNNQIITGSDILSAIDHVIAHVRETGDLSVAESALKSLLGIEKISGIAIAKLLTGLHQWWDETGQNDLTNDTFDDWVYSISTQFNPTYIGRCISIYEKQENGQFTDRIAARPIKDQQAIAAHLDQGYDLDRKQWKELERATNNAEVLEILREAKGKPPRKGTLEIKEKRDGSIQLFYEGEMYFAGYHVLPEKADSEKEKTALEKFQYRFQKGTGAQKE